MFHPKTIFLKISEKYKILFQKEKTCVIIALSFYLSSKSAAKIPFDCVTGSEKRICTVW